MTLIKGPELCGKFEDEFKLKQFKLVWQQFIEKGRHIMTLDHILKN